LILVAIAGIAAFGIVSVLPTVPSCTDRRTIELVLQVLRDQLAVPGNLSLANIRVRSGWLFGREWACAAEVDGISGPTSLAGVKFNQVTYTSEITADTRRLYVTARMGPPL